MTSWLQRRIVSAGYYFSLEAGYRQEVLRIEKRVHRLAANADALRSMAAARLQLALAEEERSLLSQIAERTPENIVLKGRKVFSQNDEDGIIAAIFATVGGGKTFIEMACGDGVENNTRLLLLDGWKGVWVDGSEDHIAGIEKMLGGLVFPRLLVDRQFIDLDNIRPLLEKYSAFLDRTEIDFLSLDLDGNDLYVMLSILEALSPRVLSVEYNAKFPPPLSVSIRYDASHRWANDDYQGCSLMAWVNALATRYTLLTCTLSGVNAFFVRNDLAERFRIYPAEDLYQPARYYRAHQTSGHPASAKWLRDSLTAVSPGG